ncbi:hypothetical protein RRG08_053851 [Elysia crispata]|uniref:Uncharacterized protein n=1 Tax=Elysia crispata TaxID=231223 RepID=A0AAE1DUE7_9GAST|nr:hypothetical protein RRG08_053851 [Elysia crispata]
MSPLHSHCHILVIHAASTYGGTKPTHTLHQILEYAVHQATVKGTNQRTGANIVLLLVVCYKSRPYQF